ncbi:unnamed protein product [Miscanthus lutarioriparius]|uniref:ABC transporter domain-containing protein n=1 Tax=Miscanthus lutarioriparius TaxID=422564 RepID=A0A811S1M8_9POAL|nr:unnamed protein product [Miscanthus lutarioriparius]
MTDRGLPTPPSPVFFASTSSASRREAPRSRSIQHLPSPESLTERMFLMRTEYDRGVNTFSPEGRLFQVEYAIEAIKLGSTTIGLKTKDGIVLAVEKRVTSPLLEPSSVEKIMEIDEHIGCAVSGLIADARTLVEHARVETQNHRFSYGEPMTVESSTQAICDLALRFGEGDEESMSRPFGVSLLIAGHDENGPSLYYTDPSGTFWQCNAKAIGSVLVVMLLGGFVLSREDMNKWWIWGYWASPMMYAQNAVSVNEFLGQSWQKVLPGSTEPLGVLILKSHGIFPETKWYWIGFGALLGFTFLFTLCLAYLKSYGHSYPSVSEETKGETCKFDWPGVLTALMGISGAGMTTLMDVLAGRKTNGYIKGSISISGYPKKQETFARVSGYCEQDDIHSPHVTVHESLLFSAWLRLPGDVSSKTRKMFIEEVMELVELTPVRDVLVGLPRVNGLLIEQRKRLTIAVELVANPSIIFMDEPTSGLDARAAAIVMRTVRNTVDTGRTVVCTIHQPSIDIFEAFDELLLLKQGGEQIYFGPLGRHSSEMIKYFEEIEGISKIEDGYNPATWMLEVTTVPQEFVLGVYFSDMYKNSELCQRNKVLIHELSTPPAGSSDLHFSTTHSRSFFTQCLACLWKQNLSYWRNPQYNAVRFFFTTVIALLFGTIFWGIGTKREKPQDLFNAMGSMYAAVLTMGVLNAATVQPVVSVERMAFYRERAAGMYSAFPYAFGQVLIELPYTLVQTCIYSVIVYAMMGFKWTVAKFFWNLFFMYFTLLYFTFCGMMAIGLTQNPNVASIVSAAFHATWNLFSGFLIPQTKIPIWWRWYYWLCPVAWSLYGMVVSQYGDDVANFVRDYLGFDHSFLGVVAAGVVAFGLLFALLFGVAIMKLNFQRK